MAEHSADIDPADVWEDYLAETDSRRLSPQGALAFGFWAAINFEKERHDALVEALTAARLYIDDDMLVKSGIPERDVILKFIDAALPTGEAG